MKERPIIFSGPMVRAILEGRKTQTRRPVKFIPELGEPEAWCPKAALEGMEYRDQEDPVRKEWLEFRRNVGEYRRFCPYGVMGDSLYVREAWGLSKLWDDASAAEVRRLAQHPKAHVRYLAGPGQKPSGRVRPSIHMPRSASRILLDVAWCRVERLKDISREDAQQEGARLFPDIECKHPYPGCAPRWSMENPTSTEECLRSPQTAFGNFWNKIHHGENWNLKSQPWPWDTNPWVWVITFVKRTP